MVILLTLTYNYTTENIFKSTRLLIKFQKHIEKINCKPSSNWGLLNIISLKLHFQQTHDFFLIRNTKKYRIILMVVFCLYVYKLKKFTTRCRSSIKKCKYDRVYSAMTDSRIMMNITIGARSSHHLESPKCHIV